MVDIPNSLSGSLYRDKDSKKEGKKKSLNIAMVVVRREGTKISFFFSVTHMNMDIDITKKKKSEKCMPEKV